MFANNRRYVDQIRAAHKVENERRLVSRTSIPVYRDWVGHAGPRGMNFSKADLDSV